MIKTDRLLLIPMDCEIIDSLIKSSKISYDKYSLINDAGESLIPDDEYLNKMKIRLIQHPEEYPFAVDYLIVLETVNTIIGSIDYKYMPDSDGVSEIGYGMNRKYEGHGYMTEAVNAMLELGKKNNVKKVVADTLIDNTKSQKVLNRCGFSFSKKEDNKLWFYKFL